MGEYIESYKLKKDDDNLITMVLVSISLFLLLLFGIIGYLGYLLSDLTYDIASKASGENTKPPFVVLEPYSEENGKCFLISNDYTIPDDGKLKVRLGNSQIITASFRSTHWRACFDYTQNGDLLISGLFAEEEIGFAPYLNSWGIGSVSIDNWTASSSENSLVGIIVNNEGTTIPANLELSKIEINEAKLISVTGIVDSTVQLSSTAEQNNTQYFVTNPFSQDVIQEYVYDGGLLVSIYNLTPNLIIVKN